MRAVLARLDRVQQTSQDAKAASQAAAAAARKAEHDVLNLQKQNSQLRDRVKDLENKQKAMIVLLYGIMVLAVSPLSSQTFTILRVLHQRAVD